MVWHSEGDRLQEDAEFIHSVAMFSFKDALFILVRSEDGVTISLLTIHYAHIITLRVLQ